MSLTEKGLGDALHYGAVAEVDFCYFLSFSGLTGESSAYDKELSGSSGQARG